MSGTISRDDIQHWLDEMWALGPPKAVLLSHFDALGRDNVLYDGREGATTPQWGKSVDFAALLDDIASRHARGIVGGGAQQMQLAAVFGTDSKPSRFLPFIRVGALAVGTVGGGYAMATEPPTALGQTQQAMRWGERITDKTFDMNSKLLDSQHRAIETRDKTIDALTLDKTKLFQALLQAYAEFAKLAHDHRMKELEYARNTEERRKVIALLPSLINTITDSEFFPASTTAQGLLEIAAESVDEGEVDLIVAAAASKPGGEIWGQQLRSELQRTRERRAKERVEVARLARETTGGDYGQAELDAGGRVLQALTAKPEPGPAAGRGSNGSNGSNGSPKNGTAPSTPPIEPTTIDVKAEPVVEAPAASSSEDALKAAVVDELFAEAGDKLGLLTSVLAGKNPGLAGRLEKLHEAYKKRTDGQ